MRMGPAPGLGRTGSPGPATGRRVRGQGPVLRTGKERVNGGRLPGGRDEPTKHPRSWLLPSGGGVEEPQFELHRPAVQDGRSVVIASVAVEQSLQTLSQGLELRARVRLHPFSVRTVWLGVGGQLLAEMGVSRMHGVIAAAMWPAGSSAATASRKSV